MPAGWRASRRAAPSLGAYPPQALPRRTDALHAAHALGRLELMHDDAGELYVLEANPIPGLTETSLLPQAAEEAGIGFDDLVGRILESAFSRSGHARA